MGDSRYQKATERGLTSQKLGWLVEECGEVLAAIGKTQRWGLSSVNPELPPEQQEKNGDWIMRELVDLKRAIEMVEHDLVRQGFVVRVGKDRSE